MLELIARGLSNQEIAESPGARRADGQDARGRIFAKLDLRDRAQAVIFAYESGLVSPGES